MWRWCVFNCAAHACTNYWAIKSHIIPHTLFHKILVNYWNEETNSNRKNENHWSIIIYKANIHVPIGIWCPDACGSGLALALVWPVFAATWPVVFDSTRGGETDRPSRTWPSGAPGCGSWPLEAFRADICFRASSDILLPLVAASFSPLLFFGSDSSGRLSGDSDRFSDIATN